MERVLRGTTNTVDEVEDGQNPRREERRGERRQVWSQKLSDGEAEN
jgi:hypothetical protein